MSERDEYPAGVPCWVDTLGPDPVRLNEFYGEIFGWEPSGPGAMPGEPPGEYYVAQLRGRDVAGVGSSPAGADGQRPGWNTYIRVESADRAAEQAQAAGGTVVVDPFDVMPAGRMAVLGDAVGARFCAWEPHDRQGAQLVNEPGAWSMSFLSSPDPEAAAAFYRSMFGWETESFSFGDMDGMLFRLPGFVGGEPEQPVARDVVATMMPLEPGDAGESTESQWGLDFWIADTDAAAASAERLGGSVIAPPQDNPAFRAAVLADPNGAAFSVSQLRAGASGASA
jgi:predicted enzyme related to lactoylglutathione lyase